MIRVFALLAGFALLPMPAVAQTISAVLEPIELVEVKSSVAGRIERIQVEEGERVVEGALLARIDAQVQEARLRLARTASEAAGTTARAEIVVLQAQSLLERIKNARDKGAAQAWELTQATQALDLALADKRIAAETAEQLRGQYELEKATLSEFSMTAPFDGTILQVFVDRGEIVDTQMTVIEIGNLKRLKATAFVPVDWLDVLEKGAIINASLQVGNEQVEAEIVSIDPRIDPASQSVRIRLELSNTTQSILAGSSILIDKPFASQ